MEYDFKSLSDYDFELLVCDLLSAQQGKRVENFRQGRDRGIDLRYTTGANEKVIVQCKHYAKTSFSGLYAAMKQERPKVERLCPKQYILVTSQFLTPTEKEKLFDLLTPFCRSTEDLMGGNEINSLLRLHPEVEQAHYKLWLTSTAVLEKIFNSEICQRNVVLQAEMQSKLRIYVQSKTAYGKAQEMLSRFNSCIISGIPGIGKTTLAEILLIYYLDKGYQTVKVRSDIKEALKAYRADQKQVFFYDDFLGSTALEMKENKNEGKELLAFLRYISEQGGKKFILTTREYIIKQARQNYEDYARENFDYTKCMISLEDYTRADRARILYNHLYFGGLSAGDIQDLLVDGRVLRIIDHPNYNPRLIETVIKLRPPDANSFYSFFAHTLDHPNQLWEHAFCRKISPAARDLLLLLCPEKNAASLSALKRRYTSYHEYKSHRENRALRMTDFMDALKETEGTFIRIDGSSVSYHNPSVRDFIHGYIRENDMEFQILCETAVDFDFCILLADLDRTLCGKYSESFTAALRRTMGLERAVRDSLLAEQIRNLSAMNYRLRMNEVQDIIRQAAELLLEELERGCEELAEETWHEKICPSDLKALLEELDISIYEASQADRLFSVFFRYALAWFHWAYIYWMDDFLLFPELCKIHSFPIEEKEFQDVYEALEDFKGNISADEIREMDYAGECEDYRENAERLEEFFRTDMSDVIWGINELMLMMQEREDDDDAYDDWREDLVEQRCKDAEILNMFQGLLERDGLRQ